MKVRVTFNVDRTTLEALKAHNAADGRAGFQTWVESLVRTTLEDVIYEYENGAARPEDDDDA